MRGWYIDAANRPPPPERVSLVTLTEERADLYAHVPPPGQPIPVEVVLLTVYYNIPRGGVISEVVLRMQLHHTRGPSVMRSEHLSMWLCAATREGYPSLVNW